MTHTKPLWFVLTKAIMLSGLIVFYLFWYVPSMRMQFQYRKQMDSTFTPAQACANQAMATAQYEAIRGCYANWETWEETHDVPESGWNWPWASYRGSR